MTASVCTLVRLQVRDSITTTTDRNTASKSSTHLLELYFPSQLCSLCNRLKIDPHIQCCERTALGPVPGEVRITVKQKPSHLPHTLLLTPIFEDISALNI